MAGRRTWAIAGCAAAIVAAVGAGGVLAAPWLSARVRAEVVGLLESRLDGTVALDTLQIDVWPRLRVTGHGLALTRDPSRHDVPFLSIGRFEASGDLLEVWRRRIDIVELEDVTIVVDKGKRAPVARGPRTPKDIAVGRVELTRGMLRIVPDNPQKLPIEFALQRVSLLDFSFDRATGFHATVLNPRPEGTVDAEGRFGPWQAGEPRRTPLEGRYRFQDAKLASLKGIGGTLRSEGTFAGVLQEIRVEGTATTPDFQLEAVGQPVPLETTFRATVDGSRGDTELHQVDIRLGSSPLTATGSIAAQPGEKGRTVALDTSAEAARLEDVLRLAVNTPEPPMAGQLSFRATLTLPPGEGPAAQRLAIGGTFRMKEMLFASDRVQDRIDELSRRGRGRPSDASVTEVTSSFDGRFDLGDGVMRVPRVDFAVRGARVRLGGSYRLQGGALDFAGQLRLDAPVSKLTTGWKSALLTVVDPVFRKDGAGTVLPITLRGTAARPAFGVDMKKAFLPLQ